MLRTKRFRWSTEGWSAEKRPKKHSLHFGWIDCDRKMWFKWSFDEHLFASYFQTFGALSLNIACVNVAFSIFQKTSLWLFSQLSSNNIVFLHFIFLKMVSVYRYIFFWFWMYCIVECFYFGCFWRLWTEYVQVFFLNFRFVLKWAHTQAALTSFFLLMLLESSVIECRLCAMQVFTFTLPFSCIFLLLLF